jgi:hypothetical protein
MNNHNRLLIYLSALLFVGSSVARASQSGTFDRALTVSGPVVLEISTNPGSIRVTRGSNGTVRVHAVIRPLYGRIDLGLAEASIRALQQNPPIEQTGDRIRIGYTQLERLRDVSMTLEVETPAATEVRAQTSSGGISVQRLLGPITATTASGNTEISEVESKVTATSHSGGIQIRDTRGPVSVRTESGGVQAMSVKGALEVQSQSGRIEVSDVSGDVQAITHSGGISVDNAQGSLTAKNHSGSIDAFQLSGAAHAESKSGAIHISQLSAAPIRALSDSGAIKINLAARSGYTIDAQSHSGKVSGLVTKNALDVNNNNSHRLQQQFAGGGPLVDLDTHSSKIEID